jgi:RNA polymerase sigma-70 factor (ECF subfamily)
MEHQPPETLAPLLALASAGDEDAWRRLVELYLPRVLAVLQSQCHDPELAEEIAQSTFCTVVQKLPSYTEVGRFESWLMRIAMNRLRDEMRRRKRHARPAEEHTLVALAEDAAQGPRVSDEGLGGGVDGDAIMAAMEGLSEADREVLVLRHVSGLSFKQLSEVLDAPVGTLLARHHRALKKLKGLLSDPSTEEGL